MYDRGTTSGMFTAGMFAACMTVDQQPALCLWLQDYDNALKLAAGPAQRDVVYQEMGADAAAIGDWKAAGTLDQQLMLAPQQCMCCRGRQAKIGIKCLCNSTGGAAFCLFSKSSVTWAYTVQGLRIP